MKNNGLNHLHEATFWKQRRNKIYITISEQFTPQEQERLFVMLQFIAKEKKKTPIPTKQSTNLIAEEKKIIIRENHGTTMSQHFD